MWKCAFVFRNVFIRLHIQVAIRVITFLGNLYLSKYPNIEHLEGKNIPLYAHVHTYYIRRSGFWDALFRELDIQVYDLVPGMPFFPLYAW